MSQEWPYGMALTKKNIREIVNKKVLKITKNY